MLAVEFDFVGREGAFTVSTLDKKPPEVYSVSDMTRLDKMLGTGMPVPDRERAIARSDYLRIKPPLAFAASLPDVMRFSRLDTADLYPYMVLDLDTEYIAPAWVVVYSGTALELEVSVDAKTGEVVSREIGTPRYEEWED